MPHTLSIVGLGPGDPSLRSIAAQKALNDASRIILRTGIHPGIEDQIGDRRVVTCDDLYEALPTFKALYPAIVDRVLGYLNQGDCVYAVPGNPVAGELTVIQLRSAAVAAGHAVVVIPGAGGLDVIAAATGLDLMADGVQTLDALDLREWTERAPFNGGLLDINPLRPLIVTQVYKRSVASAVKLALGNAYPDEHQISVIGWDGAANITAAQLIPLHELDRIRVDHLTSIVVPPVEWQRNTRSPFELFRITSRLRDEGGCPWDREQTHASIRAKVVEEAYEVVDAIDTGSAADLAEELGDLLLQAALHAQIADEAGEFTIADVFEAVSGKLIRRHPHVFGDAVAENAHAVIKTWEAVKSTEPGKQDRPKRDPYRKLPRAMPVQQKIALVEGSDGSTLTETEAGQLARDVSAGLLRFARAGIDPNDLLDAAYRIIRG